mgnify:CR=1 FL=1
MVQVQSTWFPLVDRNPQKYVDNVQITAAEDIGIEGRGAYYDEVGVVRDIVQNHVMQVLSLIAMEPPVAGDAVPLANPANIDHLATTTEWVVHDAQLGDVARGQLDAVGHAALAVVIVAAAAGADVE